MVNLFHRKRVYIPDFERNYILTKALVQKSGHNMAASEIVICDGGISERVMSDVWEVTCSRRHGALRWSL